MSNYAFTDMQSMLCGTYIFEADMEKVDISAVFYYGKTDSFILLCSTMAT